ncbi:MAG: hypothetical protein WC455_12805 [Dehalococcoidia bacterium]|jgi:hypothetical protein
MTSDLEKLIAGAIFDFVAFLTTRDEQITLSAHHNASPAVKAIEEFAATRSLSLDEADVQEWQTAIKKEPEEDDQ